MSKLLDARCRDHGFDLSIAANEFMPNGSHHPARASKAPMSKTADRVLGVHGFVLPSYVSSM
jgi:hypothetical protein